MKPIFTRLLYVMVISLFTGLLGGIIHSDTAKAIDARGGGTKCSTSTISGLRGTYNFCSAIYQSRDFKVHTYGRFFLPSSRDDERKLQLQVRYCNTTSSGTSCNNIASTNGTQTYDITWVYNNGSCSSLTRGATIVGSDGSCQHTYKRNGHLSTGGRWYLSQSRILLNGTVVKTINSPALMAGN